MSIVYRQEQTQKQTQQIRMTPQLRQAIAMLQLNRLDFSSVLQAELEQNPMLEEAVTTLELDVQHPESLAGEEILEVPESVLPGTLSGNDPATVAEINWEDYSNTFDTDLSFSYESPPADAPSRFDFLTAPPGLLAFLAWQLTHLSLDERDADIARFILGNLNEHGFLEADISDICAGTDCSNEEAEGMVRLVQSLDPPGVAARNIQESLLLQLDRKGLEDHLAFRIVSEYMDYLLLHNLNDIARQLRSSLREVQKAVKIIASLTPYPGNAYSNEQIHYITPDVYLYRIDEQFVIQLNNDDMPQLQLSSEYEAIIHNGNPDSTSYLEEKKNRAKRFMYSYQYRQSAIFKVVESLVKFQREFFEKGSAYLKPLILKDVANDIGVSESTVSRVTANKYIHTPQGIYELKYFFSTAVTEGEEGKSLTAESIKSRIRHFIGQEVPENPLSDNDIVELLSQEGIKLARRTVAKYREQLKILPAKHRRKKN
jgi:RNA polymerase sigma-54 factor